MHAVSPAACLAYLVGDSSPMTAILRLLHMPLVREGIYLPALLIPFNWYYIDCDLGLRRSITSLGVPHGIMLPFPHGILLCYPLTYPLSLTL